MNETDSRTQRSPVEIYEAQQVKQRTQAIADVKKLWASFAIRHVMALVLIFVGGIPVVGIASWMEELAKLVAITCGGAIWFLSWITAIRLGIYVAKNNRVLRLWLIYVSWLPGAIVSAEAIFVLEALVEPL